MVFDSFVLLISVWTLVAIFVIAPAFRRAGRLDYWIIGGAAGCIFIIQSLHLSGKSGIQMPEALLRGGGVALIEILAGYAFYRISFKPSKNPK